MVEGCFLERISRLGVMPHKCNELLCFICNVIFTSFFFLQVFTSLIIIPRYCGISVAPYQKTLLLSSLYQKKLPLSSLYMLT
ncbi:hypothetical protein PAHAL_9G120300 [Panicum hallii]|uniref:Uncharacterized protein n=1 Tax=Panicum hallii TaxID=206008 RepID=A0A2S3IIP3_9POAL|nr:hypothetical protein PAHAL_9G120300 [Panicum hallii]